MSFYNAAAALRVDNLNFYLPKRARPTPSSENDSQNQQEDIYTASQVRSMVHAILQEREAWIRGRYDQILQDKLAGA